MDRKALCKYMTDVEKSEIYPHLEEFQIFHTTDVEKSKILRNFKCLHMIYVKKMFVVKSVLWRFTLFSEICFVAICALLRGEKVHKKMDRWRKNDKYEV